MHIMYIYYGLAHCLVTLVTTNAKEGTRGIETCSTEYFSNSVQRRQWSQVNSIRKYNSTLYVGMVQVFFEFSIHWYRDNIAIINRRKSPKQDLVGFNTHYSYTKLTWKANKHDLPVRK